MLQKSKLTVILDKAGRPKGLAKSGSGFIPFSEMSFDRQVRVSTPGGEQTGDVYLCTAASLGHNFDYIVLVLENGQGIVYFVEEGDHEDQTPPSD